MFTLLKIIQEKYFSLSEKERKIADYILAHPKEASQSTISEIAEKTGVSVATITRFSKKVSCENFAELKIRLARETYDQIPDNFDWQIRQHYFEMIHDIQGLNSVESIERALKKISNAEKIYIYGIGSSGLAAQELNYRLSRMGFNSEAVTDPHLMIIRSSLLVDGDLLIVFSRSGQTKDLITSLTIAKKNEVKIISLTAYANTPLTDISDEVLWTIHPIRNQYLSTGLDLSALYLIDLISLHFLKDPQKKKIYQGTISAITSNVQIKK